MRSETHNAIIKALKTINPDDLDFHAARYDSGELFQALVREAVETGDVKWLEDRISAIAEATSEDGGDWGTIPCLGGHPEKVWQGILLAWGSGDTSRLD